MTDLNANKSRRNGLNLLGFSEGARPDSGGFGLVGVPLIHHALAERGHRDALVIGGQAMPTALSMIRHSCDEIFEREGRSAFGVVEFRAFGRWSYAPGMQTAVRKSAARADFVMMHSLFSYPVLAGYRLARRFGTPYGVWPHGVFAPAQRRAGSLKKAIYTSVVANQILDSASVMFYTATGEREEARPLKLRAPSVVIPHGINTADFADLPPRGAFRQRYFNGHAGPLVLSLGRLNAKKGLDLLTEVMARVLRERPDARLAIVGAGHPPEFAETVAGWVRSAGIADRTVMTGAVDENEKRQALADCDVFAMPSEAENFGFAMFEAMACGRPVVCSETLNFASAVRAADAGCVVPRTPDAMAAAVTSLLGDGCHRHVLGRNGRLLVQQYSWEACGRRVETTIRCILEREPFPADLQPEVPD